MSVTSLRGPAPPLGFEAAGRRHGAGEPGGRPPERPTLLHPLAARTAALLALCAFASVHWMGMVEPAARSRAAATVAIAALASLGLLAAARLAGAVRAAAVAAVVVVGAALALVAGGVPDEWLAPRNWDALGSAVGGGLSAVGGARVPYRGLDDQLRLVIPLGGTVLALLAALLAFWPRRGGRTGFPIAALVVLVTLYAVPAVSLILDAEFLRGAALAVLVVAFLRLERLRARDAPAAAAVAVAAAVLALAAAPALDTSSPWFDYEEWAQSAATAKSTEFSWDHDYGGLGWPRDGRELLRVRSRQRAYWKADQLDLFDGTAWVRDERRGGAGRDPLFRSVDLRRLTRWSFEIRVTVRNLRSDTLPIAGAADAIVMPGRRAIEIRPGIWAVGREIRKGDAYRAEVYVPQPSAGDLAAAGTAYAFEMRYLTAYDALVPGDGGVARRETVFADGLFKAEPMFLEPVVVRPARGAVRRSNLGRTYGLARRLLADAQTPYDYVKAVQRHLADGFTYSETPPAASRTLDGFLFETRSGYCQQFSGAMALLLRMGGVPARVAVGFAPGAYDRRSKEYVVRDVDAHSWVEAWFPGVGWVIFDPTPSAAPPRSQAPPTFTTAGTGDIRDVGTTQADPPAAGEGGGVPWGVVAVALAAAALLGGLGRRLWRRRGRPRPAATSELERALRSAGWTVPPRVTLTQLERSLPTAAEYLRALRAQRYEPAGRGPTATQRRTLRRALGRGCGPLARLRTWLALPPRLPRRGLH